MVTKGRSILGGAAVVLALAISAAPAAANHSDGVGQSFTTLQAGFTQDVFGTQPSFMGGVAFAPDGDPLTNDCSFGGSPLHRFDRQTAAPSIGGEELHPRTDIASNAGCGMTNHPDGTLYTNTAGGVVNLDANTGAQIGSAWGPGGNALGIAPDPETGNLIYVAGNGTLISADPVAHTTTTFSTATTGHFVDGIFFDPTGNFLFTADRSGGPGYQLTIVNGDTGALVQSVPMTSEPDGIAFHASPPKFVVTNNTDGIMTRFDFAGDNYAAPPVQSTFASGGFRGDLSQVGPDGCMYLAQAGTRYEDGSTDGNNSVVRICGGFSPPPGAGTEGPPGDPNCADGIDNDGDTEIDLFDPDCQPPAKTGKVSARGTVTSDHGNVTFSAANDCTPANSFRPSIVDWNDGGAKRFTKTSVTLSKCFDYPTPAGTPASGFDVQIGRANGNLLGGGTGTLEWTYIDGAPAGVPADKVKFVVKNSGGTAILTVNQQSAAALGNTPGGVWTFAAP